MKMDLAEIGGTIVGVAWWGVTQVWGLALSAMLLLAPLLIANVAAEIVDTLPATVALAIGVIGAYVIGFPPWSGEGRTELMLVVGGSTAAVIGWELLRTSADAGTLLVVLALTWIGWPIRRALVTR